MLKAKELGFKYYDFRGVDPKIYREIKNAKNKPLSKEAKSSPTFFKYGFGGNIIITPESKILIPNTYLRSYLKLFYYILGKYPKIGTKIVNYFKFD
jgi:hypothetical protein